MTESGTEHPSLDQFDLSEVPRPDDGMLYLFRSANDGFWHVDNDPDIAQQEATGYPVGELVEHEERGEYEDSESGELLAIYVGEEREELRRRVHFLDQFEELESEAIAAKEDLRRENDADAGVHLHQLQGRLESVIEDFEEWQDDGLRADGSGQPSTGTHRLEDDGSGLPQRDAGVPCEHCGCESRRPATNRCAACGRFAPDPRYAYSGLTDTWYRVTEWDDLGDGQIRAREKEQVDRDEVPQRWLDATEERGEKA